MKRPIQNQFIERVILLFIAGLFFLCSPARIFWASEQMPWFAPYLIWLLLIVLTWMLYHWSRTNNALSEQDVMARSPLDTPYDSSSDSRSKRSSARKSKSI